MYGACCMPGAARVACPVRRVLHARCGASCMPGAARPACPVRSCMPGAVRPACPARRVLASCMPGAALNSVLNSVRNVFTQCVMYLLSA